MKKLLLSAAFVVALSGYATAQSTEGTTTSATKTEAAFPAKASKEKVTRKQSKKEKKAQAQKPVMISVPVPDTKATSALPPVGN